jgi:hypothetical protein
MGLTVASRVSDDDGMVNEFGMTEGNGLLLATTVADKDILRLDTLNLGESSLQTLLMRVGIAVISVLVWTLVSIQKYSQLALILVASC